MGFNKRYISRAGIISSYRRDSIEGIHRYFSADALIGGEDCRDIIEMYRKEEYEKIKEILDLELIRSEDLD